jgi:hypothetical protein
MLTDLGLSGSNSPGAHAYLAKHFADKTLSRLPEAIEPGWQERLKEED